MMDWIVAVIYGIAITATIIQRVEKTCKSPPVYHVDYTVHRRAKNYLYLKSKMFISFAHSSALPPASHNFHTVTPVSYLLQALLLLHSPAR